MPTVEYDKKGRLVFKTPHDDDPDRDIQPDLNFVTNMRKR